MSALKNARHERFAQELAKGDLIGNIKSPLKIEYRQASELKPYHRNARTHSPEQVDRIAASIREFGWTNPVLVDGKKGVIAGHGRLLAANKLGIEKIPCIELAGLSEAQKAAYVLADNKLALDAGWDFDSLRLELSGLQEIGFDLSLTGFGDIEIAGILVDKTAGLTDPDDAPEPPADPVTELGDVWLLGGHRLVCGDSTTVESVDKALAGVKPNLMVTDPPYGVKYNADWRSSLDCIDRATGLVENDNRADWREVYALFPGDVVYVWHAGLFGDVVADGLRECGFALRSQIIWAKPHFALSRGDYHVQHEPCFYAVRKTANGRWNGDRKQSTIWEIANGTFQGGKQGPENAKTGHGTQKPVECMKRPIENNSSPGQAVYEPFSGSGTTIIAGEMTGRSVHAIELSPAYVDVAIERWQNFTGKDAIHGANGRSFNELKDDRRKARTRPSAA